jgi:hypothetical protein
MNMNVLLVNVDSTIPPLPLLKLSAWHKRHGDNVGFEITDPDKVYISCIFKKNASQAKGIATYYPDAEIDIGGCGIDLKKTLSPEIELIKPDYDLYPSTFSQGYTTRGCVNKCGFCIVPEKEGKIRIAQHPSEFDDPRFDTMMIMDNNLFGAPQEWQDQVLAWFVGNKMKMLSPQGWDARLLNEHRWLMLSAIKHAGAIHFAWDDVKDEKHIVRAIDIMKQGGITPGHLRRNISFYVLAGYGSSPFEDALYRCNRLKEMGTQAFVMPYHKKDKRINALARWANRPWLFWTIPFEKYKRGV